MFKNIYKRTFYYNKIKGFIKGDLIKVITGIRRCGKSSFMKSIVNTLLSEGVNENDIIYIDLDSKENLDIDTPKKLESLIDKKLINKNYKYLFIDEIQNIENFEPLLNAYRESGYISIFITGSNSYLLSGELATKLTGRYIEIEMFTLNFNEYISLKKFFDKKIDSNLNKEFENYILDGGFPKTIEFDNPNDKRIYVKEVLSQIFKKDIRTHNKIRNKPVFEKIKTYIINNFAATTSLQNVVDYFNKVEKIPIKQQTLYRYVEILEKAKIIYKCKRFDLRSKKSLRNEQKYYLADLSFYYAFNTDNRINYGPVLENIIYTYLSAKSYNLSIGKIGTLECDFITRKNDEYHYIQVATSIADRQVEDREYNVFSKIKDNYPKHLFTLDNLLQKRDGIKHYNIIDFISNNMDL